MGVPPGQVLDTRRFLFVTGKGGVGKTTVSAAAALALAARGKRVLIAMAAAHERLSAMLQVPPIGHDIVSVADGVWATRIDPERAMEEYGEIVLKVGALAKAVFDNRYTHSFFRAVPGLYDWALLGKAWYHTTELLDDGSPRFDVVLFDAPSTGHGLDMLRVPKVIVDLVPPGVLRRDAERAWALFRDRKISGVLVVSLPEEMPTTETIELVAALKEELDLPVIMLVVNAMLPHIFDPDERDALTKDGALLDEARVTSVAGALGTGDGLDAGERALALATRRASREQLQARSAERLQHALSMDAVVLPDLLEIAGTPEGVRRLATRF